MMIRQTISFLDVTKKEENQPSTVWMVNYDQILFKVQLFWEGHKNVRNRPYGFEIYLANVKPMSTISQIFVAF